MADPLYRQIADDLRLRIESGELPAGAQLPAELDLRYQYGEASRNTVRDAELELGEGASVVIRHLRRFVDDRPSSLQTTFYPTDFVNAGATNLLQPFDIQPGATKYLDKTLGTKQAGYRERLTVRRPNSAEAGFFGFADAAATLVVVVNRTVYACDGKPIRFTVSVYPAHRNHFVIEFGKVPPMRAPIPAA